MLFKNIFNKASSGVYVTRLTISENYDDINIPSERHIYNLINSNYWFVSRKERLRPRYIKRFSTRRKYFVKTNNKFVFPMICRPYCVNARLRSTDYEIDLVCGSSKIKKSGYLVVLINRLSRKYYIMKCRSKNGFIVTATVKKIIEKYKLVITTLTCDQGSEFEKLGLVAKWLNFKVYYCDSYKSYQKGSIENCNSIARRFFPNPTNFMDLSDEYIEEKMNEINNMPRKLLGDLSANQYEEKFFKK